jgi:pyruvyl transferase EpsO
MDYKQKKEELSKIIIGTLAPIIDGDYILLDLPYHMNIGDNLIWEGEIQFLRTIRNYKLLYFCNAKTYHCPKIDRNVIIFMHGGGNFGDVWHDIHQFKERIIASYPDNKIIIFPQTVYYADKNLLLYDASIYSAHKKLILCARDKKSYDLLKQHFVQNTVLLIPDMAFCISTDRLKKYQGKPSGKYLFLKRTDKELNVNIDYADVISGMDIDISDWPTMENRTIYFFILRCFLRISHRIHVLFPRLTDLYAALFFKRNMIRIGVKFISKYNKVYTTRLHIAILCCLLDKPFVLFDNSYGKNRSFFETWLYNLDGAAFH